MPEFFLNNIQLYWMGVGICTIILFVEFILDEEVLYSTSHNLHQNIVITLLLLSVFSLAWPIWALFLFSVSIAKLYLGSLRIRWEKLRTVYCEILERNYGASIK